VSVVGGGNVAMDCVRTARRLGFTDVNLIYRRTEAEMPADALEIKEAREEGVNFHMLMAPIEVQADADGKVSGLKCLRMELGEPDKSGRRRPVPIEGSEFVMACDAVIPAIGQACAVDQFQTQEPHIFGGGDCTTGPDILIRALAAGKYGAGSIVRYLDTGDCTPGPEDLMEALTENPALFETDPPLPYPGVTRREEALVLAPETRVQSFDEVEAGFSPAQARQEANRCLRCYRILVAAL
jgi:formate dehydrogenase beta subunit